MARLVDLKDELAAALADAAQNLHHLDVLTRPLFGAEGSLAGDVDNPGGLKALARKYVDWVMANGVYADGALVMGGEPALLRVLERARVCHPGNPALNELARQVGRAAVAGRSRLLNPACFDLEEQMQGSRNAVQGRIEPGLCVLSIAGAVPQTVAALVWRLQELLDAPDSPLPLTLNPLLADPAAEVDRMKAAWQHRDDGQPLLVVVQADTATAGAIADFLQRLQTIFPGPLDQALVVLVCCAADSAAPDGCVALPEPRFEDRHLFLWVEEVARGQGWPKDVLLAFKRWLKERARTGERHAAGRVYLALTEAIGWLKARPDESTLRRHLNLPPTAPTAPGPP